MSFSLNNILNQKLETVFNKLGLDTKFAYFKVSDRPDLSDFQCNGALALAKIEKKNPRQIGELIAGELDKDPDFAKTSVDGPGFVNVCLSDELLSKFTQGLYEDERAGAPKTDAPKSIVVDYGGPNVAKALHVGHLRSAVIGESVKRIIKFYGDNVLGDVHLGDWGTPMGMIIAKLEEDYGSLDIPLEEIDVEKLSATYKAANIKGKEDETFKEKARLATYELQSKNPKYYDLWKHFRKVSVDDIKRIYDSLDVSFDLWWGEADAHEASQEIVKISKDKNVSELSDGALIIKLAKDDDKKPMPPVILEKSAGGFTYHTTDIATILMRVRDYNVDEVVYLTDKRQSFHFEQVFLATEKLGIAPNVKFRHIGFGTVNGSDGKPFKTRDGGVMNLDSLIEMSKNEVRKSIPDEAEGYTKEDIDDMVSKIAIAAIKFQDMRNNITSDYIFDTDNFANFEGKTGPYLQYAIARINSIMKKTELTPGEILIHENEERKLALKLADFSNTFQKAYDEKEPSIISDYAYNLAQTFSSFYNACSIMKADDKTAASRITLSLLTKKQLELCLDLLGISYLDEMLKK